MKPVARDLSLDFLRSLAIIGMMAAHTTRLIAPDVRLGWSGQVLHFEPVIPSAFLFLVGISLSLSRRGAPSPSAWFTRQAKRAFGLWALSLVFYAAEEGWRFPDILVASGILCTIAFAILLVSAWLARPKPAWGLGATLLLGTALYLYLDGHPRPYLLLRIGNSPWLPMLLFALAGALWGLAPAHDPDARGKVWRRGAFLACAAAAFLPLWIYGSEALFSKPLGRYDAARYFLDESGRVVRKIGYYNLRPLLALVCLGLIGIAIGAAKAVFSRISSPRPPLLAWGRHALLCYVSHLAALALMVVAFGKRPLKVVGAGEAVLAGVLVFGWALARARDPGGRLYRRGTQSPGSTSSAFASASERRKASASDKA